VGLTLSLLLDCFLLLWNRSEDRVTRVSSDEIGAISEAAQQSVPGSAQWSDVIVQTPNLVIVEQGPMTNFRGLFSRDVQYTYYVWERP